MSLEVLQSTITSIKNNINLLSKRNKFKNTLVTNKREKLELKSPNANYYELEILRKKMQKENKRIMIEQIIVFSLVVLYFIFVGYMLFIR